ncbi:hypothetical protein C2G38_2032060 [Gigaspora rosea]|uniref:Uncharacterized protein n=1 Tax=Gigaspora rosea TaxID=44941 RepID=A0A397VNY4_9GLOM|nr:hypothetical protein C2G38_2032060 [Gigaspora rosea]
MSWTLGSLQSFIILREMKNKKKQNKQNETSESKKVNKKYNVSQQELLKMLYGRWRARHREFNIRKQGDEQVERNRRRKAKNSMLLNLLHNRINPVVELLHKKQPALKRLRITSQKYIQQTCFPPFGAPTWCLTNEALKKLNFPIENIPIYDSEKAMKILTLPKINKDI